MGHCSACASFLRASTAFILCWITAAALIVEGSSFGGGKSVQDLERRMEIMKGLRERQQQKVLKNLSGGGGQAAGEISHKQAKAMFEAMKKIYPDIAESQAISTNKAKAARKESTPSSPSSKFGSGPRASRIPQGPSMDAIKARPRQPGDPTSFEMLMKKIAERETAQQQQQPQQPQQQEASLPSSEAFPSSPSFTSTSSSSSSSESSSTDSYTYNTGGISYSPSHLRSLLEKMQKAIHSSPSPSPSPSPSSSLPSPSTSTSSTSQEQSDEALCIEEVESITALPSPSPFVLKTDRGHMQSLKAATT